MEEELVNRVLDAINNLLSLQRQQLERLKAIQDGLGEIKSLRKAIESLDVSVNQLAYNTGGSRV